MATKTNHIDIIVYKSMIVANKNEQRMADNRISNVAANVLRMELRCLRKNEVTIPAIAPLSIMINTYGLNNIEKSKIAELFDKGFDVTNNIARLHRIESVYIKIFCTRICTAFPSFLIRNSLYTPAKHEQKSCINMRRRFFDINVENMLNESDDEDFMLCPSSLIMQAIVNKHNENH